VSPLFTQNAGGKKCRALTLPEVRSGLGATGMSRTFAMDVAGRRDCALRQSSSVALN
jgi:hypothetical protein